MFALAVNWKRYAADLLRPHVRGDVLEVVGGIGPMRDVLNHAGVRSWTSVGTAQRLPTDDARFDTVLCFDVLEHLEHDRAGVERAARCLRPGGRLVVVSPALSIVFSDFDRAAGHLRRYTARTLAALMPSQLERRALFYADSLGLVLSLGNRLLLRRRRPTPEQILLWDRWVVPVSRLIDPVFRRLFGRSVIGVFQRRVGAGSAD